MQDKTDGLTKSIFAISLLMIIAVMAGNLYNFFYLKNYQFVIETSCQAGERCFIRHCGEGDECPPNNLELYRAFSIKASDFKQCGAEGCEVLCLSGDNRCAERLCSEESGDVCSDTANE